MKNFSIIIAMLFLAFTVEAQSNERAVRSTAMKSTNSTVRTKSEKAPAAKTTSTSRTTTKKSTGSTATRSSSSSSRSTDRTVRTTTPPTRTTPTEVRKSTTTRSSSSTPPTRSSSTATKSTQTRSSSATPPTRTTTTRTRTTSSDASRSSGSRTVNSGTSTSRERSTGTRTVNTGRSRSSNSSGQVYTPRTAVRDAETRRVYTTPTTNRVVRKAPNVHYTYQSIDYRRVHNPYNAPHVTAIYWNSNMYHNYRTWYPNFNLWYYPYGYRIHTISAYDAYSYVGEIARIYGRVSEVWYSRETREYYLYIGGPYPYHDFTIILDYSDARRFNRNPERYFTNRQLTVTGLVSLFEDKPEVQVRKRSQISLY